jgi:hypothetical protein
MKEFGFKNLSVDNWLVQDKAMAGIHRVLPNGSTHPVSPNEWFNDLQKPKLVNSVPEEIQKLYEVARGVMIYGYFFYPIFTFASEQFTRIAETAINSFILKIDIENKPKPRASFRKKIDWLLQNLILTEELYKKWNATVLLRNKFSHPSKQNIITPEMAIKLMDSITEDINFLFVNALTSLNPMNRDREVQS